MSEAAALVQGTLHMLILRTLALEPMHGYGIGIRLEQISKGVFQVNAGSLFPAPRRLERDGLVAGEWRVTENNRRAQYYALPARGRAQLKRETRQWEVQTKAIARILNASLGEVRWCGCDGSSQDWGHCSPSLALRRNWMRSCASSSRQPSKKR